MKASIRHQLGFQLRWALVACALATSACLGEVGSESADESGGPELYAASSWTVERDRRNAELASYIAANAEDYKWFKNAPLGNTGIPMVMFRLFPELFPEIWGPPSAFMDSVGLAQDTLEPTRVLPLGLGFTGSQPAITTAAGPVNVNVVQLTCMGCHDGRVIDGSGKVKHIIGGPNTTFSQFRTAVLRTVNSPNYTADNFRAALAAKPLGFIYGDPALATQEALERAIFLSPGAAETFLDKLKNGANAGAARFAATIGAYTYSVPNAPNPSAPKPGFLDAIGAGISIIVDPAQFTSDQLRAILPAAPAEIDIMSVWRQIDRPFAQWDSSIGSLLHRNLAAEFGVIGNPAAISLENAVRTTRFTQNLPATPYPFDVDAAKAARGKDLYDAYCAGCHAPGNTNLFSPSAIGTDRNRAFIWSDFTVAGLTSVLKSACNDPSVCGNVPDSEILKPTYAYGALPLDGLWARAPYLHNGSVPTLAALLTGVRPTTFYRGNITYDQRNVGFTSDRATRSGAVLFDTRLSGASNTGHLGPQFNGPIDWKNQPSQLADLLEYLKTL
jgi:Cytochrome C oxidase, cbb3-type, subunit III